MKRVSMSGSLRENVGKKDAKAQRNAGNVVCVLYGGEDQISFVLPEKKFDKIIFTPEVYLIDLEIAGKNYVAVLQDVQYHPVSDRVLHADFVQIFDDKAISISIPLKTKGVSPGVIAGGKLIQKMRKLKLKGLINNIPESVIVDISTLKVGMSIQVKDLSIDNINILENPSSVIVSVRTSRGIVETEDEAGNTEHTAATEKPAE